MPARIKIRAWEQSQAFAKVLQEAGVEAEVVPGAGKTHATINRDLGVPDDEPIRFEILSTNQEPIVFMELIAREAREQVQTAGVVTWLVPTEKFTPGEYTIEVGAPNGPDLLNVPVEVRQVDPS